MSTAVGEMTVRQSNSQNNSQISITSLMLKVLGGVAVIALTGLIGWMSSIESRISTLAESSSAVKSQQVNLQQSNDELKKTVEKMNDTVNKISVGVAELQRDVAHLSKSENK